MDCYQMAFDDDEARDEVELHASAGLRRVPWRIGSMWGRHPDHSSYCTEAGHDRAEHVYRDALEGLVDLIVIGILVCINIAVQSLESKTVKKEDLASTWLPPSHPSTSSPTAQQ
jgi:hypothetical protein